MTKPSEASKDHERALKSVVSKKNANTPAKSSVQSMFIEMCKKDQPKEAACLEILKHRNYMEFSIAMRHISLGHFKKLHLEKSGTDMAITTEKTMADTYFRRDEDEKFAKLCQEFENNPDEYFRKLAKYQPDWKCPVEPKEVSLYWYVAYFNTNWTMSTKPHCPVFKPAFKKIPNKFSQPERHELWATSTMLIYTPGAHPDTILDGFENTDEAMKHFVYESGYCPNLEKDNYEKAIINRKELGLQEEGDEDEEDEFKEPELCPSVESKYYILKNYWIFKTNQSISGDTTENDVMNHPELMLHVIPKGDENLQYDPSNFTECNLDEFTKKAEEVDWTEDYQKLVEDKDLTLQFLEQFVKEQRKIGISHQVDFNKYDSSMLNEKQLQAFNVVINWAKATIEAKKNGTTPPNPLRFTILGKSEQ